MVAEFVKVFVICNIYAPHEVIYFTHCFTSIVFNFQNNLALNGECTSGLNKNLTNSNFFKIKTQSNIFIITID